VRHEHPKAAEALATALTEHPDYDSSLFRSIANMPGGGVLEPYLELLGRAGDAATVAAKGREAIVVLNAVVCINDVLCVAMCVCHQTGRLLVRLTLATLCFVTIVGCGSGDTAGSNGVIQLKVQWERWIAEANEAGEMYTDALNGEDGGQVAQWDRRNVDMCCSITESWRGDFLRGGWGAKNIVQKGMGWAHKRGRRASDNEVPFYLEKKAITSSTHLSYSCGSPGRGCR
jgi:hypothetical protein